MKKVLALVLAVIMVCTMAFAVTLGTGINTSGAQGTTTPADTYPIKAGGTNFYVVLKDNTNIYFNDGKFVPAKNDMQVSITAGSELVAFKGWVKIAKTAQNLASGIVTGAKDDCSYQYQIILKNDVTRIADGKSYDFSISKIVLNATGWEPQTMWEADENAGDVIKVDVGYQVVDIDVAVSSAGTSFDAVPGRINKIASIVKDGTTQLDSATLKVLGTTTTVLGGTYAKGTLNKGATLYVLEAADKPVFEVADLAKGTSITGTVATIENIYNMPMTGVLEQTDVNAAKLYKVYAKGIDGKVASVAATLNNGVLTFNVPALSTVIVTTDTMTVTAGSSTTGSTGTTTNPGTGANDIVGVAAALAVVALVSGAAISLKK